jgi:hypothetical protein
MYCNASPTLLAGGAGATTVAALGSPVWAVLAGFAILAAGTALARIVPRRGTLRRHV